ncbi:hypothetical protein HMN09_00197500 [Mycena chlorophos]|uniref:Zn(2)-C6 fungal-type domain-containing protein n=1 Tax=Mycena chlorophos TaxID=658473 RepID=A0A8H6TNM2_MYCCL|nr:hypothetical protein HMN09_00197500 [Mycena chlorophos]
MFTNGPAPGPSTNSYTRSFVPESGTSDRMDVDRPPPPLPKPAYEPGPPLALLPAPSSSAPPPPPSAYPAPPAQAFIAHSFPTPTRSHTFAAWTHAAFAPLPATLLRRLTNVTTAEMPARDAFDTALRQFRAGLEPSLRETAFLLAEDYAIVANCLAKGNTARLSPRLREWTQCHRLALAVRDEAESHVSKSVERGSRSAAQSPAELDVKDDEQDSTTVTASEPQPGSSFKQTVSAHVSAPTRSCSVAAQLQVHEDNRPALQYEAAIVPRPNPPTDAGLIFALKLTKGLVGGEGDGARATERLGCAATKNWPRFCGLASRWRRAAIGAFHTLPGSRSPRLVGSMERTSTNSISERTPRVLLVDHSASNEQQLCNKDIGVQQQHLRGVVWTDALVWCVSPLSSFQPTGAGMSPRRRGRSRRRLDLVAAGKMANYDKPNMAEDSNSMDEISDDAGLVTTGPGAPDTSWTSRRGKARCDACRLKNLKCDRVLPVCNQCKWGASGSSIPCKYTPLPTPAHRGVPRCDRCRESNLKCDRAAPVCQYCRDANITDCRYTPKKRARPPMEPQSPGSRPPYAEGESASFMFTNGPAPGPSTNSYTRSFVPESGTSDRMDVDRPPPPLPKPAYEPGPPLALLPAPSSSAPPPPPSAYPAPPAQAFIAHSFPTPTRSHTFAAWTHAAFAPLPATLLRRLTNVTTAEMPARDAFDTALRQFRAGLEPSLRETAFLLAEDYAIVANCLAKGNTARLSPRLREWTQCHRLASGSDKFNLIVTPRDATFALPIEKAHELLKDYRVALDEEAERSKGRSSRRHTQNVGDPDSLSEPAFERIPVVNQIYDCLTYAHRGHASSVVVMMEIRRLGIATITWPMAEIFINLCPLCSKLKVGQSLGLNNFPAAVSVPVVDAGHGAGTSISVR